MKKNTSVPITRTGSISLLVLVVALITSLIGMGLMQLSLGSYRMATRTANEIAARSAADAGIAKAIYEMNEQVKTGIWDDATLPVAVNENLSGCDATFSYTVTVDGEGVCSISSVGQSGQVQRTVNSTLQMNGPWEYGLFFAEDIGFGKHASVDGYNFQPDHKIQNARIGTNSTAADTVSFLDGGGVDGDVLVGLNGDPDVVIDLGTAIITGETYAMTKPVNLFPVTLPAYMNNLPSQGSMKIDTIVPITITDDARYESIVFDKAALLIIDGSVKLYVHKDIVMGSDSELQIVSTNPNASLTLYLGGDFITEKMAGINNLTQDPQKLKVYGLDSCVLMQPGKQAVFYGAIYAPEAHVESTNASEIFGSIVAKEFSTEKKVEIHYDASLQKAEIGDQNVTFSVARWHEE